MSPTQYPRISWEQAADYAVQAARGETPTLMCLAGTSQSGKSSGASYLQHCLHHNGIAADVVSMDSFALPTALFHPEDPALGHDQPSAIDWQRLAHLVQQWRRGEPVVIAQLHLERNLDGSTVLVRTDPPAKQLQQVLIMEGLFAHYRRLTDAGAPPSVTFFAHDDDTQRRYAHRLHRDVHSWGYTEAESAATWHNKTLRGEAAHVMPDTLGQLCHVDYWIDSGNHSFPIGEQEHA